VYALARCTTEEEFNRQIDRAKVEFKNVPKIDAIIAYIVEAKETFVSCFFLENGFMSLTQITSNPIEQFYKWIAGLRTLPILSLFLGIEEKWNTKITEVCVALFNDFHDTTISHSTLLSVCMNGLFTISHSTLLSVCTNGLFISYRLD
jgi:hypothetical protein